MFWLRNNKTIYSLCTLIWRMGMRGRLTVRQFDNTIIHNQMHLKVWAAICAPK